MAGAREQGCHRQTLRPVPALLCVPGHVPWLPLSLFLTCEPESAVPPHRRAVLLGWAPGEAQGARSGSAGTEEGVGAPAGRLWSLPGQAQELGPSGLTSALLPLCSVVSLFRSVLISFARSVRDYCLLMAKRGVLRLEALGPTRAGVHV